MDTNTLKAWRFFREHAGGWVGHNAETALALARAEALLEDAEDAGVATVEWVYDPEPYEHGFYTNEQVRAFFDSNEWTGPFGCTLQVNGEGVEALWGIVVGPRGIDDPYCRVIQAELAVNAEDEIRQALGDARDATLGPCGCTDYHVADCPTRDTKTDEYDGYLMEGGY